MSQSTVLSYAFLVGVKERILTGILILPAIAIGVVKHCRLQTFLSLIYIVNSQNLNPGPGKLWRLNVIVMILRLQKSKN